MACFQAAQAAIDVAKEEFNKIADQGVALPQNPTPNFLGLGKDKERVGGKFTVYKDIFSEANPRDFALEDFSTVDPGDFYVRISDERDGGQLLYFRGFVTGITENVTPTWNPTSYVGRSEDVYLYQKGERDLSFNLRVAPPRNGEELEAMYEKMNSFNFFSISTLFTRTEFRMQPPFSTLYMAHIGSKAKGQFGFYKINNLYCK